MGGSGKSSSTANITLIARNSGVCHYFKRFESTTHFFLGLSVFLRTIGNKILPSNREIF